MAAWEALAWRRRHGRHETTQQPLCSTLAARSDFAVARTKPTIKATRSHLPCTSVASVRLWPPLMARSLPTTLRQDRGITDGGPATGPARTGQRDEHDDREAADGPVVVVVVVVDEKIVAGGVRQGVPALLVALAPALPLTVVFAGVFAAVFETPFLRHRSWPQDAGQQHPRAQGAPG